MSNFLKRLFWLTPVKPVTHNDVEPAPRPPLRELEVKAAQVQKIQGLMSLERSSWEVRHELARGALKLVSGGR